MADTTGIDNRILSLLEKYSHYNIENSLRGGEVFPTAPIIDQIVALVHELGEDGLNGMRLVLESQRGFDVHKKICAARVLGDFQDGFSLKLVLSQAVQVWKSYEQTKHVTGIGDLLDLYSAATKMADNARRNGMIDEEIIHHMITYIDKVDDWRLYRGVMEAAASTRDEQIRDILLKIATYALGDPLMNVLLQQSQGWDKRVTALYALRMYPEMQETLLSLINHPYHEMASTSAKGLIKMLDLLPGNNAANYNEWQAWAITRVPVELRPEVPTGLRGLLSRQPHLDQRQTTFWQVCGQEHAIFHQDKKRF